VNCEPHNCNHCFERSIGSCSSDSVGFGAVFSVVQKPKGASILGSNSAQGHIAVASVEQPFAFRWIVRT
jgi:hypothetical protein